MKPKNKNDNKIHVNISKSQNQKKKKIPGYTGSEVRLVPTRGGENLRKN